MIQPNFKVKEESNSATFAEFVMEPLEPGYGYTLGHALRRILLSSIPGVAVTSVKISGVKHKFSTVLGLKETVVDFLLNLKGVSFRLAPNQETATVKLTAKGTKEITASLIEETDGVEVVNKDCYLGSLSGEKAKLEVEITLERGYGYSLAEERSSDEIGVILTDAVFTPVKRVNYTVEATRVGRKTNMDKLVLQVWTNGSITPKNAVEESAKVLSSYFKQIYEPTTGETTEKASSLSGSVSEDLLKLTVDELDLPTRIYNSLRNGGIETIGDLLGAPRKELISMRNMGAKSIAIIEEKLSEKGISLNA
ncbi:MAG TPA: DNA-directed RNA polymerase subunit alpha [Patescibacteria group bacterium]|nr:DNA-directed RNA polymerase subunit alpha [Patescibacteria group bacterium]